MRRLTSASFAALISLIFTPVVGTQAQTINNCGFELEVPASPPQKIVTVKSSTTELLLALGLGDRIIGHAYQDGAPAAQWAEQYREINVLADRLPSREAVLALEPDFIFAGWESNLEADALGDRELLKRLDIGTYVPPSACRSANVPERIGFDDVFAAIIEAGQVFGAEHAASQLVAAQRDTLQALVTNGAGRSVVWYSSGTDTPYVGAGGGAPQMIMESLELENIAADMPGSWGSLSWEAIADKDPDFLILVDAAWNRAEDKIARLEKTPFLAQMQAVRNRHYLIVPFPATEAGVRNLDAVVDLNAQIATLDGASNLEAAE